MEDPALALVALGGVGAVHRRGGAVPEILARDAGEDVEVRVAVRQRRGDALRTVALDRHRGRGHAGVAPAPVHRDAAGAGLHGRPHGRRELAAAHARRQFVVGVRVVEGPELDQRLRHARRSVGRHPVVFVPAQADDVDLARRLLVILGDDARQRSRALGNERGETVEEPRRRVELAGVALLVAQQVAVEVVAVAEGHRRGVVGDRRVGGRRLRVAFVDVAVGAGGLDELDLFERHERVLVVRKLGDALQFDGGDARSRLVAFEDRIRGEGRHLQ